MLIWLALSESVFIKGLKKNKQTQKTKKLNTNPLQNCLDPLNRIMVLVENIHKKIQERE